MDIEITHCPECGHAAEVIDRFTLPSTDGPVEHVKTRCVTGRWFVTVGNEAPPRPVYPA